MIAGIAAVYAVVCAELARSLVARIGTLVVERWFGVMKLPGRGSRKANVAALVVGPLGAYLGVSILAFALYSCHGIASGPASYTIDHVADGYDAVGKLERGDRILELDGTPREVDAIVLGNHVNERAGAPVTLTIERDGVRRSVTVRPTFDRRWLLGVALERRYELATDIGPATLGAIEYPFLQAKIIIGGLVDVAGDDKPDPGGPTRIVAEHTRSATRLSAAVMLQLAMMLGVYALLVLALVDLTRLGLFAFRQL